MSVSDETVLLGLYKCDLLNEHTVFTEHCV